MTIPFLGSRVIRVTKKDMEHLLSFSDTDVPPAMNMLEAGTQAEFNKVTACSNCNLTTCRRTIIFLIVHVKVA